MESTTKRRRYRKPETDLGKKLLEICATCGEDYGTHRAINNGCPPSGNVFVPTGTYRSQFDEG